MSKTSIILIVVIVLAFGIVLFVINRQQVEVPVELPPIEEPVMPEVPFTPEPIVPDDEMPEPIVPDDEMPEPMPEPAPIQ